MSIEDENYKRSAEIVYTQNREMLEFSLRMQGEYGKWLISSLLFLHSAAIAGLLFKSAGVNPPPYLPALWWFVIGIVLALAAGFSAWCNFTFAADQYYDWADHRMLTDRAYWPKPKSSRLVDATLWIAVVTGVLSVGCIIGGAFSIFCMWR